MDVRDSTNPLVLRAGRWLDVVNSRHPWNHNEHFHGWILRSLPARRQTAVDVGCGTGVLAGKLASHFARVTGIDADEGMSAAARARLAGDPRVTITGCRFDEFAATAGDGEADLITMVAVLHHLDLGRCGSRPLIVGRESGHGHDQAPAASPSARSSRGQSACHAGPRSHQDSGRDRRDRASPPAGRRDPATALLSLHPSVGQAPMIVRPASEEDTPGFIELAGQVEQWFGPMAGEPGFRQTPDLPRALPRRIRACTR